MFKYSHKIPPLPEYATEKLSYEEQSAFARAKITEKDAVLGWFLRTRIMTPGRLGDRELNAEQQRRVDELAEEWRTEDFGDDEDGVPPQSAIACIEVATVEPPDDATGDPPNIMARV